MIKFNQKQFTISKKKKFKFIKKFLNKGLTLEVGSGEDGGSKKYIKNLTTSELKINSNVDIEFDIYKSKFKKNYTNVIGVDVLHHLARPFLALKNLKKNSNFYSKKNLRIIFYEPYVNIFSFFFYFFTIFLGPKEPLGIFKKIDENCNFTGLEYDYAHVTSPQKFIKKKLCKVVYISDYHFMFTGGKNFNKVLKYLPDFFYNLINRFDCIINKQNIKIKKIFATKILIILDI